MESADMAASPTRHRWLRYSFRAFLTVVTVIVLAVAMWSYSARKQQAAVASLRNAGATVYYDYQVDDEGLTVADAIPPVGNSLADFFGIDYFSGVAFVRLKAIPELDLPEQLRQLRTLSDIRFLQVQDMSVDDSIFEYLSGMHRLEELIVWDTEVTGAGLVHLQNADQLTTLRLAKSPLKDEHMCYLKELDSLEWLSVFDTPLTDACLPSILSLENLRSFDPGATAISMSGRRQVVEKLNDESAYGESLPRPSGQPSDRQLKYGNYTD